MPHSTVLSNGQKEMYYNTSIMLHSTEPIWHETVRLAIPVNKRNNALLIFMFRHRSSVQKSMYFKQNKLNTVLLLLN